MMNNNFNNDYYLIRDGDRVFWAPLLLGGLGGAAIVGLSRPRPVFVNPAYPNYGYGYGPGYYPYRPGGYGYSNQGYNYYY